MKCFCHIITFFLLCNSFYFIHASDARPIKNLISSSIAQKPNPEYTKTIAPAPMLTDSTMDIMPAITQYPKAPQVSSPKNTIVQEPKVPHKEYHAKAKDHISHDAPPLKHEPSDKNMPTIIDTTHPMIEPNVLYQSNFDVSEDNPTIAFNFEQASLQNLLSYMEQIHNIKFITDDIVPTAKDIKGISGHTISYRTNKPLTRKESWNLCTTFLHIAGFDIVPMQETNFYRIVPLTKANFEALPTYIGVDKEILPENDMIVRYVHFLRNIDPSKIQPILIKMQSASAKLDVYHDLKALIFTDRSSSIKSLMQIVNELDRAALPEVLSIVKLKRANAKDVIDLYKSLRPSSTQSAQQQKAWVASPNKKESSIDYFPSDIIMVNDSRTNSLILLGTAKDVARVEEFITKYVDSAIDQQAPPIFTYKLQYTNAKDLTDILTKITSYGASTEAGKYGGVRDGIKYFQKMTIIPDSWSNTLIINATPEDYQALIPLIKNLDAPQKQIGLEVLFVSVKDIDNKTLGAQISGPNGLGSQVSGASPYGPTFFQNASAQTSGINPGSNVVVTRNSNATTTANDFSIKSSLASLLGGTIVNEVGSVLVTFGQPIWAVFKILQSITSTHVITNPFVVVSNNSTVTLASGEERRQLSGEVISSSAVKATGLVPIQALLNVTITPQINNDNMINMNINIQNQQFVSTANQGSVANQGNPRDLKQIQTVATVANGETLVLGGIMTENYASASYGVPLLQNIPVLGWFFKSKTRKVTRDHFLIFISPRVLESPTDSKAVNQYTEYKLQEAQESMDLIDEADWFLNSKDPIQKAFFGDQKTNRTLQEMRTGKNFAQRESIDGKINKTTTIKNKKTKNYTRKQPTKNKKQSDKRTKTMINQGVSNVI